MRDVPEWGPVTRKPDLTAVGDPGKVEWLPAEPTVTAETPFRATGGVTLSAWLAVFRQRGTPFSQAELEEAWKEVGAVSALALHLAIVESQCGTSMPAKNNWLGLRIPGSLAFQQFAKPADCARELVRRWTDPGYKGGVYMPRELSLRDMYFKYSPPNENPTEELVGVAVRRINEWRGTEAAPASDPWRPYPYPPMVDLIVPKPYEGAGFDRVSFRRPQIRGFCTHITDGGGTIESIAQFFGTGGERARDALTDLVIGRDGRIGLLNDWRDPNRGGTRAGWANGGTDGLEGDGVAFYRTFPYINTVLVSCEHIARAGEAWTSAQIEASIEIRTAIMQELRIPWDQYPVKAEWGVSSEQQHRNFATKSCPAEPYIGTYDRQIKAAVRERLREWQGGGATPVPRPEEEKAFTRFGLSLEQVERYWGSMTRVNDDGTEDELPFNPEGPLSLLWLERCDREGVFPEAEEVRTFDSRLADGKERWATWEGGWVAYLPIDNQRAGWKWLMPAEVKA